MLYYDKSDVSDSIDTNKINESHKCIVFHYNYYLNKKNDFEKL